MVASSLSRASVVAAQPNSDDSAADYTHARLGGATLVCADCTDWLRRQAPNSIHAVVTDPPYGLL